MTTTEYLSCRLWDIGDIGEGQQGVDGDVRRDQWIWDTLMDLLVADIFVKIIRLRRYSVVVIFFCLFVSSSRSPGVDKRKKMKIADLIQGQLPLPTIVSPLQQVTENLNNVPISVQHASLAEFYIFFTLEKCHPKL